MNDNLILKEKHFLFKRWLHPNTDMQRVQVNTDLPATQSENVQPITEPKKGYTKYSFTIQQMWVDALMFDSGMLSVRCVTFNPHMVEILKGWRREGRGYYNKKHTS